MRWGSFVLILFPVGLGLAADVTPQAGKPPGEAAEVGKRLPEGPVVLITVSKETTHITEPLDEDGYVDYLAALNARYAKGVTPENNGAVLFWKAFGPKAIEDDFSDFQQRADFLLLLGIPHLPAEGDYYVELASYLDTLDAESDAVRGRYEYDQAMDRPWTEAEFPILAGWFEANEKPIELIVEGTKRPRFHTPYLGSGDPPVLIAVLLPGLQRAREAARALKMRAMLHLGEGRVDEAWANLMACHRLARQSSGDPTLVGALVGIAIEGIACHGDAAVARFGKLDRKQAARFLADLDGLPPASDVTEKVDVCERYMLLDSVTAVARRGPGAFNSLTGSAGPSPLATQLFGGAAALLCDWDQVLRMGNSAYDRLVSAMREPDSHRRRKALDEFEEELWRTAAAAGDWKSVATSLLSETPRAAVSRRIGNVFISLLLPAVQAGAVAEERSKVTLEMTQVAMALAAYRSEHGEYPRRLARLVPEYLEEIPADPFGEGEVRYKRRGKGYLLYSFGMNREDDEGRSWDQEPYGDDVVIRMPGDEEKE
ncbi:MAG: hypothetical protein ACYTG0_06735 [Planctomycetota bacterium]|jgi:hypothetical protein